MSTLTMENKNLSFMTNDEFLAWLTNLYGFVEVKLNSLKEIKKKNDKNKIIDFEEITKKEKQLTGVINFVSQTKSNIQEDIDQNHVRPSNAIDIHTRSSTLQLLEKFIQLAKAA